MSWRCDHLPTGSLRPVTEWHDTEAAAVAQERGLRLAGVLAVAWEWGWKGAEACDVAAVACVRVGMDPSYTGVVPRPKLNDPMGVK